MSVFYKCVLNGEVFGKDNKNTLWYRSAIDPLDGAFNLGGAPLLAELIRDGIGENFLDCHTPDYQLQSIDIYPISEAFSLLYQLPYRLNIDMPGTAEQVTGSDGAAICANVRFNLEPVLIGLDALTAPRRGYIAVGPLPSSWMSNSGELAPSLFTDPISGFNRLCASLAQNLQAVLPPALFFPIRVSAKYGVGGVGGGIIDWGYADVSSCSVDHFTSFRRSRRITG
jgi:hypothetical protein